MISLIIPVYNVEAWLGACLDSVMRQSLTDWEALVVDDGSTDGSPALCDSYARRDKRFRVIHKKNRGVSSARNVGLDNARGDTIFFIDSDDMIHERCLEWLHEEIVNTNADIASCGFIGFDSSSQLRKSTSSYPLFSRENPEECVEKILYQTSSLQCSVCGKLYRKVLWDNIRFNEATIYEDLDIFSRIFRKAKIISHTSLPLYFYRRSPGSLTHVFNSRRLDVLDVTSGLERSLASSVKLLRAARDRSMSAAFNIMLLADRHHYPDPTLIPRCEKIIRERRIDSIRNSRVRLKNKAAAAATLFLGFNIFRKIGRHLFRPW